MDTGGIAGRQPAAADEPSMPATQVERMRVAIGHVVTTGPEFIRSGVDPDHMANTTVRSVRDHVEQDAATMASHGDPHARIRLRTAGSVGAEIGRETGPLP